MCSTAETTLAVGALMTRTPRAVAAGTSTLSTPTPARATTWRASAPRRGAPRRPSCALRTSSASAVGELREQLLARRAREVHDLVPGRAQAREAGLRATFSATTIRLMRGDRCLTARAHATPAAAARSSSSASASTASSSSRVREPPARARRGSPPRARTPRPPPCRRRRASSAGVGAGAPHRAREHRRIGLRRASPGSGPRSPEVTGAAPSASRISRENAAGLFDATAMRQAPRLERAQDVAHSGQQLATSRPRPPDSARGRGARPRPPAPVPPPSRGASRARAPPCARTCAGRRRRQAEPRHRVRERVADRGVAVDQRAVEIEDDELQRFSDARGQSPASAQHGLDDRPPVARRRSSARRPSAGAVGDARERMPRPAGRAIARRA